MKKNGFAPLLIILIIAILSVGLYFYFSKVKQSSTGLGSSTKTTNYDGHYEYCEFKDSCNYINVKTTNNDTFVDGQAFWEGSGTVNEGKIAGVLTINSQNASYDDGSCKIDFAFSPNQVVLKEKLDSICGGLNILFDGTYTKK